MLELEAQLAENLASTEELTQRCERLDSALSAAATWQAETEEVDSLRTQLEQECDNASVHEALSLELQQQVIPCLLLLYIMYCV